MASMFDLDKHDARFHKNGYKKGDTCKFRDEIKEYEGVDDLESAQKIIDALEDAEMLESQISAIKNDKVRSRMREHQKAALSRAQMLRPKKITPNKPLPHNESAFPSWQDTDWQDAIANYGNSRYGWHSAGSGSTNPYYIDFKGKRYFVKQAGRNPSYTGAACRNEVNANQFIRMAGFIAPDSKIYDGQFGTYAVSEAADISRGPLASGSNDLNLRSAVADAYPLMALMYNMDIMQNADNAFIDANGNPVFLDNGSTFGFSAQGARNKYYDFDERTDPFPKKSISGGLTGLLDVGNNGSHVWDKFLSGKTSKDDLLKLCAKYNMSALVEEGEKKGLFPKTAVPSLKEYAKNLDKLADPYRTEPRETKSSPYTVSSPDAFWRSAAIPDLEDVQKPEDKAKTGGSPKKTESSEKSKKSDGGESKVTDEQKIADLASKYGLSVPKIIKNSDGTVTLSGFGNASDKQMLGFVRELNEKGLLPGFIAALSGSGKVQVQSAINSNNAGSLFGGLFSGLSFGGSSSTSRGSSSHGSLNGVSSGGFSWSGGGLTSSSASSLANQFNSQYANSGYTAKATQTSTGEWQVTLYPTDQKKIAKEFSDGGSYSSSSGSSGGSSSSSSSSSAGASGSSSGSGGSSSSSSASGSSSSESSSSSSSGSSSSGGGGGGGFGGGSSGSSGSSSRPTRQRSSSGSSGGSSSSSSSASPAPTPAPNINTQTPQQVAATVAQMPKAAAGAFVNMLKRREANPATPAGLKAKYQRILSLLGQSTSQPTAAQPSTTANATMPANIPNTPGANRLVRMINATSDPQKKASLIASLYQMIGSPAPVSSAAVAAAPAAAAPATAAAQPSVSSQNSQSPSAAAMALNTPLAERLRKRLALNKPGTPFYQSLVNQLNTLASNSPSV